MTRTPPETVNVVEACLDLNAVGVVGTKRSYLWHQAQVCMSLARATNDPVLKERYEDLAVEFAQNAERERLKISDFEPRDIRQLG